MPMQSKFLHLKPHAIEMRKTGLSIRNIAQTLDIPKSTLSGWLKNIPITNEQALHLIRNRTIAFQQARIKASLWHKEQKQKRIKNAESQANNLLSSIEDNKNIQELALAMLYWGEGFKADRELGIGNSDPRILRFFIKIYTSNFNIPKNSIKCGLHLRADQNAEEMKEYWSKELDLPLGNFNFVNFDKRTLGSKTRDSYKGVCLLHCSNVAIKRKLMYIAETYCDKILGG